MKYSTPELIDLTLINVHGSCETNGTTHHDTCGAGSNAQTSCGSGSTNDVANGCAPGLTNSFPGGCVAGDEN